MMNSADNAPVIDLVLSGGGEKVAKQGGVLIELLGLCEIGDISASSGGVIIGACLLTAQQKAMDITGQQTGHAYRQQVQKNFKENVDQMWWSACSMAAFSSLIESSHHMPECWRDLNNMAAMNNWLMQSAHARVWGNGFNYFPHFMRQAIPGIEKALADPRVSRFVSNCHHIETGAEVLTESKTLAGDMTHAPLDMHAASCALPPRIAAIHGLYIDGVLSRNAAMAGALSPVPLRGVLRIDVDKPDADAYVAAYKSYPTLQQRAAEAFARTPEPMPTDRPAVRIAFQESAEDRGCVQLPTPKEISRMQREGAERMRRQIQEGLLEKLRTPVRQEPVQALQPEILRAA